jgi:hypothetical protein
MQLKTQPQSLKYLCGSADNTETRTTAGLVHQMLYRSTSGKLMSMNEGNVTSSESDGTPTRTHGSGCASVYELTIS